MNLLFSAFLTYTLFLPIINNIPPPPQRGIFINPAYAICSDLHTLNIEWYTDTEPIQDCDVHYVPRAWYGITELQLNYILDNSGGWMLTIDEPNIHNISPQMGAIHYRFIEGVARPRGIKLVAPTPSQHPPGYLDPLGYTWLREWMDEYEQLYGAYPQVDAFAWNVFMNTPEEIQNYLIARHNDTVARGYVNTPHWVTGYGGECWWWNNGNFEVIGLDTWFEEQEWIDRYAWFGTRINGREAWAIGWESCSLLDTVTGNKTALGELYR